MKIKIFFILALLLAITTLRAEQVSALKSPMLFSDVNYVTPDPYPALDSLKAVKLAYTASSFSLGAFVSAIFINLDPKTDFGEVMTIAFLILILAFTIIGVGLSLHSLAIAEKYNIRGKTLAVGNLILALAAYFFFLVKVYLNML